MTGVAERKGGGAEIRVRRGRLSSSGEEGEEQESWKTGGERTEGKWETEGELEMMEGEEERDGEERGGEEPPAGGKGAWWYFLCLKSVESFFSVVIFGLCGLFSYFQSLKGRLDNKYQFSRHINHC